MTTAAVLTAYTPRWAALYAEADAACLAAVQPLNLPAYFAAEAERAMVARVLLALYDLREQVAA